MAMDPQTGYPACKNPSCKRYGHSHPNCHCYNLAHGGPLFGEVYCDRDRKHSDSCIYYAQGGEVEGESPVKHPGLTIGHYSQDRGLLEALNKPLDQDSIEQGAERGDRELQRHSDALFQPGPHPAEPETDRMLKLKDRLDEVAERPEQVMEIPHDLDEMHAPQLGINLGNALTYLRAIKPTPTQASPLDKPVPPSKMEDAAYERQLHLVEKPSLALKHVHQGRLLPQDMKTLGAVYPQLLQDMKEKVQDGLINHMSKSGKIPHKQRASLSLLLGTPLDFSQTASAMQAIINTAAPQQQQRLPAPKKNSHGHVEKKPTSAELKQINKTDELAETPLESRLINKNKA